jgi:hypothetical protein
VVMGMKQGCGEQCHQHCDHTEKCAEPLHIEDSRVGIACKSTASIGQPRVNDPDASKCERSPLLDRQSCPK